MRNGLMLDYRKLGSWDAVTNQNGKVEQLEDVINLIQEKGGKD